MTDRILASEPIILVASLNARLQPLHRGEFFEDPLDEVLQSKNIGSICGGGTMQSATGEIEYCDVEIEVPATSSQVEELIMGTLEQLGAPKGSKLVVEGENREVPFGKAEGVAVYLNGTDLPDEIYRECDSNFVHSEFDRLLEDEGKVYSYWQGPTETALYLYGRSYVSMTARIEQFIRTYPLCRLCRVVQIA